MSQELSSPAPVFSEFADDPDLACLVALFVEEMPGRIEAIREAHGQRRWNALERAAHQLKGAAGSYGFDALTPYASKLEQAVREKMGVDAIAHAVQQLVDMCQRVTADSPGATGQVSFPSQPGR